MPHELASPFRLGEETLSKGVERRRRGTSGISDLFSSASSSTSGGDGGGGITRAEFPSIGELVPAAPDLARIRMLTQEEQAPDLRRLRSATSDAISRATAVGDPLKSRSLIRSIIEGFGGATENIARGARGRAQGIAGQELEAVSRAGELGFAQRGREAAFQFEADLKRELQDREAALEQEFLKQRISAIRPANTVSGPTFNPFGSLATTPSGRGRVSTGTGSPAGSSFTRRPAGGQAPSVGATEGGIPAGHVVVDGVIQPKPPPRQATRAAQPVEEVEPFTTQGGFTFRNLR